ncbi:MAG: tetratricopeptide repeat protein, partial [Bacteroidia bacterium]|nr:tetratricopeptide repeat protein [Bacteroidia bacterium]
MLNAFAYTGGFSVYAFAGGASKVVSVDISKEAIALFHEVLKLNPKHHASMFNIAKLLDENGEYAAALKYAVSAQKLDPTNLFYNELLIDLYEKNNQPQNAIKTCEAAIKQFPKEQELKYALAEMLLSAGNYARALEVYDQIEAVEGITPEVSLQKQRIYTLEKQPDKAIETIKKLIEAYPVEIQFRQLLYDTYLNQQQPEEALKVLTDILKNNPNEPFALFRMVDYYRSQNKPAEASAYLEKIFANESVPFDAKIQYLGELLPLALENTELKKVIETYSLLLLNQNPQSVSSNALRGDWFLLNNQSDSACVYYKTALRIENTNERIWEQLLNTRLRNGNWTQLQKESEEALEINPNQISFLYNHGLACFQLKEYTKAANSLEKAAKLAGNNVYFLIQIHTLLGDTYHYLKQPEKSDKAYEKVLEKDPNNLLVLNNYAYFLSLRKERLQQALEMIEKVIKVSPDNASYMDTYGWVLYQLGRYQEAVKWLEKA